MNDRSNNSFFANKNAITLHQDKADNVTDYWKNHKSQCGIDIPEQSNKNLETWYQRALECYSKHQIEYLQATWFASVVPKMKFNHVTRDLKSIKRDGALKSINARKNAGSAVSNAHTAGIDVRLNYVYFTLALDGLSPRYWRDKNQLIQIDYAMAKESDCLNELSGLWIGHHHNNKTLPTQYYDGCSRTVFYEDNQVRKYYFYEDGSSKEVVFPTVEEIFCASKSVDDIFIGLFYQIIVDISDIGNPFLARLLDSETTAEILENFFRHGFVPCEYPEAKLCGQLVLDKPYVKTCNAFGLDEDDVRDLFLAIDKSNIDSVKELLIKSPQLSDATQSSHTALSFALQTLYNRGSFASRETIKRCEAIIDCLYEAGADPSLGDAVNVTLFDKVLSEAAKYPEQLNKLIRGIPLKNAPYIRRSITFYDYKSYTYQFALLEAVRSGNVKAVQQLLNVGVKPRGREIPELIFTMYNKKIKLIINENVLSSEESILWLVKKFDITFKDRSVTPILHLAIEKHAIDFVRWWKDAFPEYDMNTVDKDGNTILHLAVKKKSSEDILNVLIHECNLNPHKVNHYDKSPYAMAIEMKYQPLLDYVEAHAPNIGVYPETYKAYAKSHSVSGSAMVIMMDEKQGPKVLFVRKQQSEDVVKYPYLFPGGFRDAKDVNLVETAERECFEETGLQVKANSWLNLEYLQGMHFHEHAFAFAEYEGDNPEVKPNDDVAEAIWIPWNLVERVNTEYGSNYYYNNILIEKSNAVAVDIQLDYINDYQKNVCKQIWISKLTALERLVKEYENNDIQAFKTIIFQDSVPALSPKWLRLAMYDNRADWIDMMLELKCSLEDEIQATIFNSETILMIAIREEKFEFAHKLIKAGADVNHACARMSVLSVCVSSSTEEAYQFLNDLLCVYKVNLAQDIGIVALEIAIKYGNDKAVKCILDADIKNDIDINQVFTSAIYPLALSKQFCLLQQAVSFKRFSLVKYLCERGAKLFPHSDINIFEDLLFQVRQISTGVEGTIFSLANFAFSMEDYYQYHCMWKYLTSNNYNFDYKSNNIKIEITSVSVIYKRLINDEVHILLEYEQEDEDCDSYKNPMKLPTGYIPYSPHPRFYGDSDEIVMNNSRDYIKTSETQTLIDFHHFSVSDKIEVKRYLVVDDNGFANREVKSSSKLFQNTSSVKEVWVKWSDIFKSSNEPLDSYYCYNNRIISKIDACICEHMLSGTSLALNQEKLLYQFLETKLLKFLSLQAYVSENKEKFDHYMQSGASLNAVYRFWEPLKINDKDCYTATITDIETAVNNGKNLEWFTPYERDKQDVSSLKHGS